MNICVIGTGYVGLVTGTCFAEMGNKVWCVDVDTEKIARLKSGILPIYEPGLKELVMKNVAEERLAFSTQLEEGLKDAVVCFIAVGTPPGEDGSADVSYVLDAASNIGATMNKYLIVVNKSTVPVGTADKVKNIIKQQLTVRAQADLEFDVVSNPEFLKEGAAVADFMRPDRVVIGTDNVRTAELMKQLYEPFSRNQQPILIMDIKSAEITKYAANAMLATRISFMNEIAQLCDKVGGDIANVRLGIGSDSRIGMQFLYAGSGYGGSCFPKDVKELVSTGCKNGIAMDVVSAVEAVNERQKYYLVDMVKKRFGEALNGRRFALWGLAFKPQTDDMREAPSITIIKSLIDMGATIQAYDPEAIEQAKTVLGDYAASITYSKDMLEAVQNADALLVVTEWRQFRQPDFVEIKSKMNQPVIFDGRNQYRTEQMARLGFEYYCIGRSCYVQ
ncbi:UDP-glucose/GDP-mannose dehydrogenase family protein [Sporomusa sp. KB1]|jgi:UDPglucose 6-dehydrogenase|uniref:UDP-glucose dehydrogenase family protein n=1 Tax=Sporomusa sp. KB1 TaxID=943346 RepID=UPI00119F57AF|nr:UDP-glucose/GDP-mannose dehydrogenase family protein [Sporomusa sp. KB1]TWH47605.1 UDPglucose 6-dehydrogenase [Sporomusa sp. KB1]